MASSDNLRFTGARFTCPSGIEAFESEKPRIRTWLRDILGVPLFSDPPPLNPRIIYQADDGGYWRRKVRYGNEADDVVWAWLLVPKELTPPVPAVICLPGSFMTPNWGKDGPAGLAGPWDAGHPEAYGADLAKLGYITLCPDYPCVGERTTPGLKPYDTSGLGRRFPSWTRVGLSAWDVSRAVDFLLAMPEVDGDRIGCTGWSQGGQMSLIGAALDPRIAVVASVCGWSPLRGLSGPVVENMVRSFNFPRLTRYAGDHSALPFDFDHLAALIAPHPFLDIRATGDQIFYNIEEIRDAETELAALYDLCGMRERYRSIWFEGPHAYTTTAARETQAWLYRWLWDSCR